MESIDLKIHYEHGYLGRGKTGVLYTPFLTFEMLLAVRGVEFKPRWEVVDPLQLLILPSTTLAGKWEL
jgi:hypothetical protein